MKLKAVFTTLGIISLQKNFLGVLCGKIVEKSANVSEISEISENNFNPCDSEENCLSAQGE
jgi:hypothetical protein